MKANEKFDKFFIETSMREDLFKAVNNFEKNNSNYDTPEEKRYVEHMIRDY